jgi:DNA mismatch endonuclease, patch repair protein
MRGNKRRNTRPEIVVRKWLREAGLRGYRLHWKASGSPDIAFPGKRVAIFIHGCFWHGCHRCRIGSPRHNASYWREKINKNRARDLKSLLTLRSSGWKVFIVRECAIYARGRDSVKPIVAYLLAS